MSDHLTFPTPGFKFPQSSAKLTLFKYPAKLHDDILLYPGDDDIDDVDDDDDDDDDGEQQEEVGQQDLRDDDPGPAASLPQPVTLETVVRHFSEPGQSILKS